MRLINTKTLGLEEFVGDNPYYAILSHRWEDGEVTLQDLKSGRGTEMAGYTKIVRCCEQAARDGWQYAVSDSRCFPQLDSD